MTDRRPMLPDDSLQEELRAVGRGIAYPPTPELASGFAARSRVRSPRPWHRLRGLTTEARPGLRRGGVSRGVVLALLAILVAAGVAAAGLGLRGLQVLFVPTPAPPTGALSAPTGVSDALDVAIGRRLGLGAAVTLEEARRLVPFRVRVPTLAGFSAPDAVYVAEPPVGGQVSLVFGPGEGRGPEVADGVGLVITQFEGTTNSRLVAKELPDGALLQTVRVDGSSGYWITGEPHNIIYLHESDQGPKVVRRLAANTLVWEYERVILRIESGLGRDEAIELAESLR